jgi:hypothetical protein
MSPKRFKFGLGAMLGAFTVAAMLLGFGAYIVDRYHEEQISTFRRAYLEGRVTKVTARQYVGDEVDSWPAMPPIRPTREPWRDRKP